MNSPPTVFDRRRLALLIVDFPDFNRRHVAILGEPGVGKTGRPPPVGLHGLHADRRRLDDEVRRADRPFVAVGELQRRRHVGGIALRRTAVRPLGDPRDFLVAQRDVVLVMLNADALLDVPRRHRALLAADAGATLDRRRIGPHLLVGQQRHRRQRVGAMTVLTTALENRRDVLGERHPRCHRRLSSHVRRDEDGRQGRRQTARARRRFASDGRILQTSHGV